MKKNKLLGLGSLLFIISLSSCLKEKTTLSKDESNNVVEIYNPVPSLIASTVESEVPLYAESFNVVPAVDYTFYVSYSGSDVAPQDIQVTLDQDPSALDYYNETFDTEFEQLPTNMFTVASWQTVIKKGTRIAEVKAVFKTDQFDLTKSYAIPLKITASSFGTISRNYGTVIFSIVAKNKYDGVYQMKGIHNRPGYIAPYDTEIELHTAGPNSVYMYFVAAGSIGHPITVESSGGLSWYGNTFAPAFVFNETTNAIVDIYNYPIPGNPVMTSGPATNNRYDEATKTIYAQFYYANNLQRMFSDTLVYLHER